MQISNSLNSFNVGQTDFARLSPSEQYGGLSSGGFGEVQSLAAYALGRREGAAAAADTLGGGPRIFSPETNSSNAGGADAGTGSGGNCPGGNCSSGGEAASGGGAAGAQIVQQLLQALAPMLEKMLSGVGKAA
jgi:hypothetical protein